MTKENIIAAVLGLSQSKRIRLAQYIWEIVARAPEATVLTKDQTVELDRRLAEIEADPSKGHDWDETLAEIRSGR